MFARRDGVRSVVPAATGGAVALAGTVFVGVGLWARRETRRALERERVAGPDGRPVRTAPSVRATAELIRSHTVAATGGRTYSEVDPYLDATGEPTADESVAAKDERTGGPLENPEHYLWIQSTTLQGALLQAYTAYRLSELTVALGGAFVAAGVGLALVGRR
ncbi:MAG TPA: hypothetical protein VLD16_08310 [Gaiellaceae bacterium]|nr:hypothetical protein [Gaiellaceae bacterium]